MIKRLFYDLEVSPNIGFFWQPGHKVQIGYENIIQERAIICVCFKWEHEKKVHSLTWKKGDDKDLLKSFIKVANHADELVAHNGDKFDLTWLRTRCLLHNVPMFPKYVTIDTLKVARGKFRFNSNRLDYIGKVLGIGKKLPTGFDLWREIVLKNDEKKLKKLVAYCKHDVRLLEGVFKRLNPFIEARTHSGNSPVECPECGSNATIFSKKRKLASGQVKIQIQCTDCGKYHTITERQWSKRH